MANWSSALAGATTFDQLSRAALSTARLISAADGATFVLRDGDRCFYADEDAIAPLWKGQRFPITDCISGWAMLHGDVAEIADVELDERIPIEAYRPTFVRSLTMVPMGTHEPVGAIGVYWCAKGRRVAAPWLPELVRLAASIGDAVTRLGIDAAPWAPNFSTAS